jgi:hypothetical protein
MPCVLHVYFFVFDLFCLSFFLVFVFLASLIFFFYFGFVFDLWSNQRFWVNSVGSGKKKRTYTLFGFATFLSRVFWPKDVFGKHTLGLFGLVLLQNNLGFFTKQSLKKYIKKNFLFFCIWLKILNLF